MVGWLSCVTARVKLSVLLVPVTSDRLACGRGEAVQVPGGSVPELLTSEQDATQRSDYLSSLLSFEPAPSKDVVSKQRV